MLTDDKYSDEWAQYRVYWCISTKMIFVPERYQKLNRWETRVDSRHLNGKLSLREYLALRRIQWTVGRNFVLDIDSSSNSRPQNEMQDQAADPGPQFGMLDQAGQCPQVTRQQFQILLLKLESVCNFFPVIVMLSRSQLSISGYNY